MKKVAISSREPKCKPTSILDRQPGWPRRQSTPSSSSHLLSQPLLSNTRSCKRNTSPRASSRRSFAPPPDAWQIIWLFMPLRHQTLILLQTVACLTSPASLLRQCQRQEACARLALVQQLFLLSFPSALTPWPLNALKPLLQPTQSVPRLLLFSPTTLNSLLLLLTTLSICLSFLSCFLFFSLPLQCISRTQHRLNLPLCLVVFGPE